MKTTTVKALAAMAICYISAETAFSQVTHTETATLSSVSIAPTTKNNNSELIFAEDPNVSAGIKLQYDGKSSYNNFNIFGYTGSTLYGPHLSISRNDGKTTINGNTTINNKTTINGYTIINNTLKANSFLDQDGNSIATKWKYVAQTGVISPLNTTVRVRLENATGSYSDIKNNGITIKKGSLSLYDENSNLKFLANDEEVVMNTPVSMKAAVKIAIPGSYGGPTPGTRLEVDGVASTAIYAKAAQYQSYIGHSGIFEGGQFLIKRRNGTTPDFFVNNDGNITVGTETVYNGDYKLSVNGKVACTELKVDTDWADFVFEDNYKLRELEEVEDFINENKHLPDVPSAKQVQEEGLKVAEMQTVMMQKIEELTLYMIELKKENKALKAEIEALK